jgi:hypothetical protein
MHFAEENNSGQQRSDHVVVDLSIDEHAPLVHWNDATSSSSMSSSTSSRMNKPMSRGGGSFTKSPPQKMQNKPAAQRFRARSNKQARRQHKKQQVVDSALAKVEAATEGKSDTFINETLDWMENGSRHRTASDMSETPNDGSSTYKRQATIESIAKTVPYLAKDVLKKLPSGAKKALERVYHKGLTYKAGLAAWSIRARHDWTTFYETTTPEQRRDRAMQWCKRRKRQFGVALALLLVIYVLRSSGSPNDIPKPGTMDTLSPGVDAAATQNAMQQSQSETRSTDMKREYLHQNGALGAATYFDNVDGLLRGSRQSTREGLLSSDSSDKQTVTKKKKDVSEDEPDIPLTAPWRPRKRDESKRPPDNLPKAFWHPRHRPLSTKHYATLKNAPGEHAAKVTPTDPVDTKTIKEYNPIVGNQVLQQWERNFEKKQQHSGVGN